VVRADNGIGVCGNDGKGIYRVDILIDEFDFAWGAFAIEA
jgi:hypothetical protein